MTAYYTNLKNLILTDEGFTKAGEKAARKYNDRWFACDVLGKTQETGTVIVKHRGIKFEVWLERMWGKAQKVS